MKFKQQILFFLPFVFLHLNAIGQKTEFPYTINKSSYFILPSAIALELSAKLISNDEIISKQTISGLQRTSVNKFDISATYNWNSNFDKTSDILIGVVLMAPLLLTIPAIYSKNNEALLVYSIMYSEAIALSFSVASLSKSLSKRYRPYLYNTNYTIDDRYEQALDGDYNTSFFSRHTSLAFCSATFLSKTFVDIYGKSVWSKTIWISSHLLAGTVGVLRYQSGQHFPTDIIVGALVGSSVGLLVPHIHKKRGKNISACILPGYAAVLIRL